MTEKWEQICQLCKAEIREELIKMSELLSFFVSSVLEFIAGDIVPHELQNIFETKRILVRKFDTFAIVEQNHAILQHS